MFHSQRSDGTSSSSHQNIAVVPRCRDRFPEKDLVVAVRDPCCLAIASEGRGFHHVCAFDVVMVIFSGCGEVLKETISYITDDGCDPCKVCAHDEVFSVHE